MTLDEVLAKLGTIEPVVVRIETGVATLLANQSDPAKVQAIGDGVDAALARLTAVADEIDAAIPPPA